MQELRRDQISQHEIVTNLFTGRMRHYLANLTQQSHAALWDRYTEHVGDHADSVFRRYDYEPKPTATTYCSSMQCARHVWYGAHLTEKSDPADWRGQHTFEMGYQVECWIKALLDVIGAKYGTHVGYELAWELPPYGRIYVGPDIANLFITDDDADFVLGGWTPMQCHVIGEIKSASAKAFDTIAREGLQSAKPNYYSQCQLGMYGAGADVCVTIIMCKNTGRLHEIWVTHDGAHIAELDELFYNTHVTELDQLERRALEPIEKYHRGKTKPADATGPLRENRNKNDRLIGWYEVVDHILSWQCGYCPWRTRCWSTTHDIDVTLEKGKPPVYHVTERPTPPTKELF